MDYKQLLSIPMQKTLGKAGYRKPTAIQEQSLSPLLAGKDLIGIAQTGTGKTAAFAVPVIEKIFSDNRRTQAVVICPTRELAMQTCEVFRRLSVHKKLRVISVYGGQPAPVQIKAIRVGAQIIVGTPGRMKDLIQKNVIKLKNVRFAVIDEADEMLDFGFLPDIRQIFSYISERHQTMLFSATMSKEIEKITDEFLVEPACIRAGQVNEPAKAVNQLCIKAEDEKKLSFVTRLIADNAPRLTLIFCNTRRRVKKITKELNAAGTGSACIHGDLSQKERDKVMNIFRNGKQRVLVATDVAARGLDVREIDLVINYDVPDKPEYYVHRIGRTGRAGTAGTACTLVNARDRSNFAAIKKRYDTILGGVGTKLC